MSAIRGARLAIFIALGLAVAAALYFARAEFHARQLAGREQLGLMSSLPIYWDDGAAFDDIVAGAAQKPWVRDVLETRYRIAPLDALAREGTGTGDAPATEPLAGLRYLLIAQPRGLSPADNVALDNWVKDGGHLLYALDPMLTGTYTVPFSDPRHPTLIGMLPPVLPRWGIEMEFTERQPFEVHEVAMGFGPVPVMMGGKIVLTEDGAQHCQVEGEGLLATCRIGKGRVTLLADAALFELPEGESSDRDALLALAEHAFE